MTKRILVDMSATLIHHGHIRLLKKASELGDVIVGLSTDEWIIKNKNYTPELSYDERAEIMLSIRYVKDVVPCDSYFDNEYLKQHNIDLLVHGDDNGNPVPKGKLIIYPRTEGISSSEMRKRVINSMISMNIDKENQNDKIIAGFLQSIKEYFKMD